MMQMVSHNPFSLYASSIMQHGGQDDEKMIRSDSQMRFSNQGKSPTCVECFWVVEIRKWNAAAS